MLPAMGGEIRVRRLVPEDWKVWRDIRLAALADAPSAFGASLAEEQRFDEARWRRRLLPSSGMAAVALDGPAAVGLIGGWTPEWTDAVQLVALWVDPAARGQGIADALVTEVIDWSTEHGHPRVELRVTNDNNAARTLYLRHGFIPTGDIEPLDSNPTLGAELLVRELS
jgi:ribosomal protein S18 acetylase RimI-like enzyme